MKPQNKTRKILMIILAIGCFLAWISVSLIASAYCVKWLHESGATMVTKDDIMQAYIAPFFMFGVIFFVLYLNIEGRAGR